MRISARAVFSLVDAGLCWSACALRFRTRTTPDALYEAVDDDRLLVMMILDEGGAMRA